jgi:hypothetical protein
MPRVFKTKRFGRDARKARIGDEELCGAIAEVVRGQADDLAAFRALAEAYTRLDDATVQGLVSGGDFLEICNG